MTLRDLEFIILPLQIVEVTEYDLKKKEISCIKKMWMV